MDEARARQLAIWRTWTPQQRLAAMGRMLATALTFRDRHLRLLHPDVDDAAFRALRVRATLASSPMERLV